MYYSDGCVEIRSSSSNCHSKCDLGSSNPGLMSMLLALAEYKVVLNFGPLHKHTIFYKLCNTLVCVCVYSNMQKWNELDTRPFTFSEQRVLVNLWWLVLLLCYLKQDLDDI